MLRLYGKIVLHFKHVRDAVCADVYKVLVSLVGDHPLEFDVTVLDDDVNRGK